MKLFTGRTTAADQNEICNRVFQQNQKWYPDKGLTTAEYEERADKWLKLLREITRK